MGFKLLNVEERFKQEAALGLRGYGKKAVAEARARIEDALKGNNNPTVHSYDDTDPGLLLLLDRVADVDRFDGAIPRDHDAMDALEDLAAAIPTVSLVYPANLERCVEPIFVNLKKRAERLQTYNFFQAFSLADVPIPPECNGSVPRTP